MSLLDQVKSASEQDLAEGTEEGLENLLGQLQQEKEELLMQTVRVREVLNTKLRQKQLHARFGSHIADLVSKVGEKGAQQILKDASKSVSEQVITPARIATQTASVPLSTTASKSTPKGNPLNGIKGFGANK